MPPANVPTLTTPMPPAPEIVPLLVTPSKKVDELMTKCRPRMMVPPLPMPPLNWLAAVTAMPTRPDKSENRAAVGDPAREGRDRYLNAGPRADAAGVANSAAEFVDAI